MRILLLLPSGLRARNFTWLALLACGGLAVDGSKPNSEPDDVSSAPQEPAQQPETLRGELELPEARASEPEHPEATPGWGQVGADCGTGDAATRSVIVGTVELRSDPQCGAASWCLMRAAAVEECASGTALSTRDCTTEELDFVPVPPPRAAIPDWRENVCTCRCDAEETDVDFCSCPAGMRCAPLIPSAGVNAAARTYLGSYCIY